MQKKTQIIAFITGTSLLTLAFTGIVSCGFMQSHHSPQGLFIASLALGVASLALLVIATFCLTDLWHKERAPQNLIGSASVFNLQSTSSIETSEFIRQSRAFLDSVIENIPNMIFVKDAKDLRFVQLNKAGETLLGHSRQDLIGKTDYDFFPSSEADEFTKNDRNVLEEGHVADFPEEPLSTRFGMRYVHTKKIPIMDQSGKPQYLLGISEDITERKTLEAQRLSLIREQLARSEAEKTNERLGFIADASAILNRGFDLDSTLRAFADLVVTRFSDWCTIDLISEQTQLSERVVIAHKDPGQIAWAKTFHETFLRHEIPDNGIGSRKVLKTGVPELYSEISDEFLASHYKDSALLEDLKKCGMRCAIVVPIMAQGSNVIGTITLVNTQPQRRYGEVDLSLAQDLSRSLSFSIQNARLFQGAQDANRAKSSFLANMSHEIRTPLGAMLGYGTLLNDDDSIGSEQKGYIAAIIRNGKQLLEIVDEVLDLAKVESDRIHIEKLPFSVVDLVADVTSLLKVKAQEKFLTLTAKFSDDLPECVISDPTRVRQILVNVIGNAIKFTEKGSITLSLRLVSHPLGSKDVVEIAVEDTGIGIPESQQDRLFQPFTQADNSMTRRFGGSGLGLFLSRKLARLLNGDLVLQQSSPQNGSRFVVSFEVDDPSELENAEFNIKSASQLSRETPHTEPFLADKHILMVDDSADNRSLFKQMVSALGYDVEVAGSGSEAISKTQSASYDVVFMDIQMPDMDGFQTLQNLRALACKVPVVALTAHAMKGFREKCLSEGFDDYLFKPLDRDSLKNCLSRIRS
ncbi:MAG: response regulator [Bdellovibrionota bacterium]